MPELSADELDIPALVGHAERGGSVAGGSGDPATVADESHILVSELSERNIAGRRRSGDQFEGRSGRDAEADGPVHREKSVTATLLKRAVVKDIADAVLGRDGTRADVGQRDVALSSDVRPDQSAADVRHAQIAHLRFNIHRRCERHADREIYVPDLAAALIVFDEIDVDSAAQTLRFDVRGRSFEIGGDRNLVAVPSLDGDRAGAIQKLKPDVLVCGICAAESALSKRVDRKQCAHDANASG